MRLSALVSAILISFLSLTAAAQTQDPPKPPAAPPNPEQIQQATQATMRTMGPVAGQMAEFTLEAQLATAAKPETAERIATFKKNLYDDLIRKGFNPGQALQITIATSPPGAATGSR